MRYKEPDRDGIAISSPNNSGSSCITSLKRLAVGPNTATAAKPVKKPTVAPNSPCEGVPFNSFIYDFSNLGCGPGSSTLLAIPDNDLPGAEQIAERIGENMDQPAKRENKQQQKEINHMQFDQPG